MNQVDSLIRKALEHEKSGLGFDTHRRNERAQEVAELDASIARAEERIAEYERFLEQSEIEHHRQKLQGEANDYLKQIAENTSHAVPQAMRI